MDLVHEERTLEHFVDHLVLNIKHKDSLQVVRHCQTMGGITYCHFFFLGGPSALGSGRHH